MASEPKTRPTDVPVSDFIATVDSPRRRAEAEVVRAMMEEITGDQAVMWGPSIVGFGSYPTKSGDWPRAGFSPRKAEMVIYLVPDQAEQQEQLSRLGPHRMNVSCLYIKNLDKVDQGVLRELIQSSHDEMQKRYPQGAQAA
jgi:hypothetical protein